MSDVGLFGVTRRSRHRGTLGIAAAALSLIAALSCPAASSAQTPKTSTDHNWAGYAVTSQSPIQRARGAWTQPSLTCGKQQSYSAFWVGLGGFKKRAHLLEQIGTQASCNDGRPEALAFYALYPTLKGRLDLRVRPGNQFVASVVVLGHRVSLNLYDVTTHEGRTRNFLIEGTDTSSAEWIAEAPALRCGSDCLLLLPLANFGEVTFTEAEAATQGGAMEAISGPSFSATELLLRDRSGLKIRNPGRPLAHGSVGEAIPGDLSPTGTSFLVTWTR